MKTAGGIVAIIAGVFAVIAAGVTLMVGGLGSALKTEGAGMVVGLGWGGVLFSFLTIVFGAVALGAKARAPGVLLIVTAVLGAFLGGTLVAIFMALALIGGILVLMGGRTPSQGTPS